MGKGSQRRPRSSRVSREEEILRWKLALGEIKRDEFDERLRWIRDKRDM